MIKFDDVYYKNIIKEYGYDSIGFAPILKGLAGMSLQQVRNQWCCSFNFSETLNTSKNVLYTTGVGMSGPPHMGTIAQLYRAIRLQKRGCNVQIVLGDIDAYTGRHIPWEKTGQLAEKYRLFIKSVGFNDSRGTLLSQSERSRVLLTNAMVAGYMSKNLADRSEEDLHDTYVSANVAEKDMTFSRMYSLTLMCSDFIDPLLSEEYSRVIVFLGIDEHKYVLASREILSAMSSEFSRLNSTDISALYSPLIKGFYGFPKMSKSFPQSSISITDSMDVIKKKIYEDTCHEKNPHHNVIFQLMCSIGDYTDEELEEKEASYIAKNHAWDADKDELVNRIAFLKEVWLHG